MYSQEVPIFAKNVVTNSVTNGRLIYHRQGYYVTIIKQYNHCTVKTVTLPLCRLTSNHQTGEFKMLHYYMEITSTLTI